jgi:hypothetical protein
LDAASTPTYKTGQDMTQNEFDDWISENPQIFKAFCDEAIKAALKGFKHYSARTIIEFLRHHTHLREASGGFKINNDAVPYMARLFKENHPHLGNFFEYRSKAK